MSRQRMQTLPFQLSSEAEAWLSRLPRKEGQDPGFSWCPRYGVYLGSDLIEEFSFAYYVFVYASAIDWASERGAMLLMIGDRGFWITPEILDGLRGKTLAVIQSDVGKKQSIVRRFLVARDHDLHTDENHGAEPLSFDPSEPGSKLVVEQARDRSRWAP